MRKQIESQGFLEDVLEADRLARIRPPTIAAALWRRVSERYLRPPTSGNGEPVEDYSLAR
jgi:hypothetical protein